MGEPRDLPRDDGGGRDEQRRPAPKNREWHGRRQHDHGKRRSGRGHTRVDCLQAGRESGSEKTEDGDELRRPGERNGDCDGSDHGCERKREPVRHQVVASGRRGEACVAAADARADRAHRRLQLSVPRPHPEAGADGGGGGDDADPDAHRRSDPATVCGEDEEEDDPERRDGAADDCEPARAEEIPVTSQVSCGTPRRARRSRRLRRARRGNPERLRGAKGLGGGWRWHRHPRLRSGCRPASTRGPGPVTGADAAAAPAATASTRKRRLRTSSDRSRSSSSIVSIRTRTSPGELIVRSRSSRREAEARRRDRSRGPRRA